jgi:hypothetical protein
MGFHNLELFNRALLGKHGWSTHLESLYARVLKTKYFPNIDFIHATLHARASATWCAIMAGRDSLAGGLIKSIRDGSSVSIWTDRWIPGLRFMTPLGQIGEVNLSRVSSNLIE